MSYQGSQMLKFLSDASGLPIDQLNFLVAQLIAIFSGFLFRNYLKPCPSNTLRRHIVVILLGILLGHFCFGRQMWHLFSQAFISYLALQLCPRKYVHLFIFFFSMSYLSGLHVYRQIYDYGNYTLDVTSPMMIITQKLTSLAFAYHDGMKPLEKLSHDQRSQAIRENPHIIEFLSYIFNFQGIIVGPLCYYQDYIDFINGNNILKNQKTQSEDNTPPKIIQPSTTLALIKKTLMLVGITVIYFKVTIVYTIKTNLTYEMLNKPFWYRFAYYYMSASSQRFKYYLAWVLADIVNNASGLGFNGYDKEGNAKWDLVSNVKIIELETSTSVKKIFDNWNIQTQLWLRRIAYDRLPSGKTLGVFVLSAFWHGFYPGYYLTFVLCAFLVYGGRGIRRKIRPFFMKNQITKMFYSIITWLGTISALNYAAASFDLLEFWAAINFYNTWYWYVHAISIILVVCLPVGSTKQRNNKQDYAERKMSSDSKDN